MGRLPVRLRDMDHGEVSCVCQSRLHQIEDNGGTSTRDSLRNRGSGEAGCTNRAVDRAHLHEAVVDRNNEHLAGILEFGRVDVSRDMTLRAGW